MATKSVRSSLILIGTVLLLAAALPLHGDVVLLADTPDYDWWYGCSPTSAGMLMGYYDIHGYGGLLYDNFVPGGEAELSSYGGGDLLIHDVIASDGHVADFWAGYGQSGNDPLGAGRGGAPYDPEPAFDSLADFMGTSQDINDPWKSFTSADGFSRFYNYNQGYPLSYTTLEGLGGEYADAGCVGIAEYVEYAGYEVGTLFNQKIDAVATEPGEGVTFEFFKAEIDAGRPSLIHIVDHTMLAFGYDDTGANELIYVHDTWSEGDDHTMIWGGTYGAGQAHLGFTFFTPAGGSPVPEPGTLAALGLLAGLGMAWSRARGRRS